MIFGSYRVGVVGVVVVGSYRVGVGVVVVIFGSYRVGVVISAGQKLNYPIESCRRIPHKERPRKFPVPFFNQKYLNFKIDLINGN